MSASRITRIGRSRFFIGLGIFILSMGFVAIFQSSQQQLNELRHMELRCEREQKLLNNQLEDVEKSLKTERHSHQQTRDDMQNKAHDEKELNAKTLKETNLKLSSLQQHYKLLKTENDDKKEEWTKAKAKLTEDVDGLQKKIKSMSTQHGLAIQGKNKEIELLKANSNSAEIDRLNKQIAQFKKHTDWRPATDDANNNNQMEHPQAVQTPKSINKNVDINFSAQIPVSENMYQIPIKIVNHSNFNSTNSMPSKANVNSVKSVLNGVAQFGLINNGVGNNHNHSNKNNNNNNNNSNTGPHIVGVINSVENFQLMQKPLAEPLASDNLKSSTAKISNASPKTSEASMNEKFNAPNGPMPDQLKVSSTTATNRKAAEENFGKPKAKQVPNGVVPIQVNLEEMINRNQDSSQNGPNANENAAKNNRYVNVVDEAADSINAGNVERKKTAAAAVAVVAAVQNNNEAIDNVAHEVNDNNDFILYHKDHIQAALGDNNNKYPINNAAEEDMNLYDNKVNLAKPIDDGDELGVMHRNDDKKLLAHHDNNKLLNEINGDEGRVAYGDDAHLEEQMEEEDDDEYANPGAHKEVAERN